MRPHIEARAFADGRARVVFLYPKKQEFAAAARAIKIRGAMQFGRNPIEGKFEYKAFYADIKRFDPETYGTYAMLVRDFYASDIQEKFNSLFPGLDHASIPASIHNPNAYMEAHRPVVERLIAKYRDSTSPLEFYGSKHMAEGVAIMMDCLAQTDLKGAILADEQGMAKTIQAIIAVLEMGMKRLFVVAPKTARATSWPSEALRKVDRKMLFAFGNIHAPGTKPVQFEMFTWDDLRRLPHMGQIFEARGHPAAGGQADPRPATSRLADLQDTVRPWSLANSTASWRAEAHRAKLGTSTARGQRPCAT